MSSTGGDHFGVYNGLKCPFIFLIRYKRLCLFDR